MCKAGIAGYNTPRVVLSFLVRRPMKLGLLAGIFLKDSCSGSIMYKSGFVGCAAPRAVFSSRSQAYDASHHDRYEPEEHVSSYFPQVPVVCNDTCPGPAAHHSGGAADAAHHQGHLHPRRGAEFGSHGSDCSADHRDSTVAVPRQ